MKQNVSSQDVSVSFSDDSAYGWPVENFMQSLGLTDFTLWKRPQIVPINNYTEISFWGGMSISVPKCMLDQSQWLCKCSNENGFGLFWVNEIPVAAIVANDRELKAVFADIPSDIVQLSCRLPSIRTIPKNICRLRQLEAIDFSDMIKLSDIDAIGQLSNLRHVSFLRCKSLRNINPLKTLSTIESLDLQVCVSLDDISGLSSLTNLSNLYIMYSPRLESVDAIKHCQNLKSLILGGCQNIKTYSALGVLNNLVALDLTQYNKSDLAFLRHNVKLEKLILSGSVGLNDIDDIRSCCYLQTLKLDGCKNICDYSPIGELNRLQYLDISHSNVWDISFLQRLPRLIDLNLWSCEDISSIEPIGQLFELKKLDMRNRWQWLDDLSPISGLSNLEHLELGFLESIKSIHPLSCLVNLKHLNLGSCKNVTDLTPVGACPKLSFLRLETMMFTYDKIKSLDFVRNLSLLDTLVMDGASAIASLDDLSCLSNLRQLWISDAGALVDISGIENLPKLSILKLTDCKNLADISAVKSLGQLKELDLSAPKVVDISPIGNCECMTSLRLECAAQSVDPISNLSRLRFLTLKCCAVSDLSALQRLRKLETLNIESCPRVRSIEPLRAIGSLAEIEHHLHPGIVAEILGYTALIRKDIAFISQNASGWLREAMLFDSNSYLDQERLASTLGGAFSLLDDHEIVPEYEGFLDRHPEFSATPWKAWLQGSLKNSGFDVMRQRIERIAPENFTAGMIGGICSAVPEADAGENVQIKWASAILAMIEKHFADRSRDLLPVSAELCLAYSRLADMAGLRRWLVRFTDPSDPAALDPVQDALGRWQLRQMNFMAAFSHAAAISKQAERDNLLNGIASVCVDVRAEMAAEILLLIETADIRSKLASELARNSDFVQTPDNVHRLIVAAGEFPQDLATIIGVLIEHESSQMIEMLSQLHRLTEPAVKKWKSERMNAILLKLHSADDA